MYLQADFFAVVFELQVFAIQGLVVLTAGEHQAGKRSRRRQAVDDLPHILIGMDKLIHTAGVAECIDHPRVIRIHQENEDTSDNRGTQKRVSKMLSRIDMDTILFFLGILMAVGCLETIGVLTMLGENLNVWFSGNHYLITGIIGVLSSIVDNVPLVAGCMGMYPVEAAGDMAIDGIFWQLLAYCAGVGGSMLIIGSAAGVVVMGLEKITFGWYMKKITWVAFTGYLAGIVSYWALRTFIFV